MILIPQTKYLFCIFIRYMVPWHKITFILLFVITSNIGQSQGDCFGKYSKLSLNDIKSATESILRNIEKSDTSNFICIYRLKSKYHDLLYVQDSSKIHQDSSIFYLKEALNICGSNNEKEKAIINFNLSTKYNSQNNLNEFYKHVTEASKLFLKLYGETSTNYIATLNSLGYYHSQKGNYTASKKILEDARNIKNRMSSTDDMQYSRILNQLGDIYIKYSNYEKAEECFAKSIEIKRNLDSSKKSDELDIAKTEYNYAKLLLELGKLEESSYYIKNIIDIFSKSTKYQDELLSAKELQAHLLWKKNDFAKSKAIFMETIASRKVKDGNYAKAMLSLSEIYLEQDSIDLALNYCNKALDIIIVNEGKLSINYAIALRKKAIILFIQNPKSEVGHLHQSSLDIIQKVYKIDNVKYIEGSIEYMVYLFKKNNIKKCIEVGKDIDENLKKLTKSFANSATNTEIGELGKIYKRYFHLNLNLIINDPSNTDLKVLGFNNSIFYKSYILQTILKVQNEIKYSLELSDVVDELKSSKKLIVEYIESGKTDSVDFKAIVRKKEEYERTFKSKFSSMKKLDNHISFDDIFSKLLINDAIIDFIRFEDLKTGEYVYGAFVLTKNDGLNFIKLFYEKQFVEVIQNIKTSKDLTALLYKYVERGSYPIESDKDKELPEVSSLYYNVWQPISQYLKENNRVYYSCDGLIHNFALHAIPLSPKTYVTDSFTLIQLTSLSSFTEEQISKLKLDSVLLIGDVNYGLTTDTLNKERTKGILWPFLHHTSDEISNIAKSSQKIDVSHKKLVGLDVTKKNFINLSKNMKLIHIATHGYFNIDKFLVTIPKYDADDINKSMKNNGIVLSNANLEGVDGYFSAEEISELNLSGTELVTLSACESGLGRVYENEGVYGLKRAFKIAGAHYIIMSLWSIDDKKTSNFMTHFYELYLEQKINIEDAFNQTQRYYKNEYGNPTEWAGFTLIK